MAPMETWRRLWVLWILHYSCGLLFFCVLESCVWYHQWDWNSCWSFLIQCFGFLSLGWIPPKTFRFPFQRWRKTLDSAKQTRRWNLHINVWKIHNNGFRVHWCHSCFILWIIFNSIRCIYLRILLTWVLQVRPKFYTIIFESFFRWFVIPFVSESSSYLCFNESKWQNGSNFKDVGLIFNDFECKFKLN